MLSALLQSLFHPSYLYSLIRINLSTPSATHPSIPLQQLASTLSDDEFCTATLQRVSRSFALVIQQLPPQLRPAITIFYLVLRALDSVEDDMSLSFELKLPLLREFYKKLELKSWSIENVGDSKDYRVLLANFDKVLAVHHSLPFHFQSIIVEITQRMGSGMAEFMEKHRDGVSTVDSVADYDLYCHYVAGLVGIGLTQLFATSGLESVGMTSESTLQLSNEMGLFLQKTNIIRDYYEDLCETRTWWPREIWSQHGEKLSSFAAEPTSASSLDCLNAMINDALRHIPPVLLYMSKLRTRRVYEFCAIPQVMAIATLAECYSNTEVLNRNIKISKGLSCWLMLNSSNQLQVKRHFRHFALQIQKRIPTDSNAVNDKTRELIAQVLTLTASEAEHQHSVVMTAVYWMLNVVSITMLLFSVCKLVCSLADYPDPINHSLLFLHSSLAHKIPQFQHSSLVKLPFQLLQRAVQVSGPTLAAISIASLTYLAAIKSKYL